MLDLIGIAALLGVTAYTAHKARRAHEKSFEILEEVKRISAKHLIDATQQLQAAALLQHELKLDRPLPPTRGWAASPDFLLLIAEHVLEHAPETIVECSSGTSTVVLARAAQLAGRGHVYSLEHEAAFADRTRDLLAKYNLVGRATVLHAPLVPHSLRDETWPWYDDEALPPRAIDLLVIDGPPMPLRKCSRYPAGPRLLQRLSANASVFLDDADRVDEQQILSLWLKENSDFVEHRHFAEKGCAQLIRVDGIK